ncbi:MAG TPA: hypothetical protein VJJ82_00615 [Candidatus Nanoarchaeia archaeon]|nr:hypothetical protein [Candidatus Nanoarchaeia archaeon]
MRIPKRYGQSQINKCPFCELHATTSSASGVPVCIKHKTEELPNYKCMCGRYLVQMKGKFGVFFNCINCGNMNLRKVMEINQK